MPNPTVDVIDAYGHVVTRIDAAVRAEAQLAGHAGVLHLRGGRATVALSPAPQA